MDYFPQSLSFGGGAINQVNIHLFVETMPFGVLGTPGSETTTANMGSTR